MMKPKIKRMWVEALRSGQYRQGRGQLRDGDRFCCLGVLCNLHAITHPKIASKQRDSQSYMGESGVLPATVVRWAGLSDAWGDLVRIKGMTADFPYFNDHAGVDFKTLADAIEEQL